MLGGGRVSAQRPPTVACTLLGQTPGSAFPICATDTFRQTTVPICTNKTVTIPGCPAGQADYADKNPFWYRFTCYQAGTLTLKIIPNDLADDYDWQLYDVTGITNLDAVYTNINLFVAGNWSGSSGITGATALGKNQVECGSVPQDNINTFSLMPTLQKGHQYLLLVSHYSNNQSGYQLTFAGGTAVITDTLLPAMKSVLPSCDAATLSVKTNKMIRCNTLAGDGSDFSLVPALALVSAATGGSCAAGFDSDSLHLTLSNPLPPGSYSLVIKTGTDANTLLDDCDRNVPVAQSLNFTVAPLQPTLPDSIGQPSCAPSTVAVYFTKGIRCSSIAADGSDFHVNGPVPVAVKAAAGNCVNGLSATILLTFTARIVTGGTYTVQVRNGSDGNTIIDACGQVTPLGSAVAFTVGDTVSANFTYQLKTSCKTDTIYVQHDGAHGANQWQWILDGAGASVQQTAVAVFRTPGEKQVSLRVSNGFCSDSLLKTIVLDSFIRAGFTIDSLRCPEDAAVFMNSSHGKIATYNWNFGDGNQSQAMNPPPENFPKTGAETTYPVSLIVRDNAGCADTAVHVIRVLKTCYIAVPSAFTPNGDGNNDYLYPLNAVKAQNLDFNVYNRYGQLVFHTADWTKKWDGRVGGHLQSSGTFAWTLRYHNPNTGKEVILKGTSVLIR